jgi:hypothetical protein
MKMLKVALIAASAAIASTGYTQTTRPPRYIPPFPVIQPINGTPGFTYIGPSSSVAIVKSVYDSGKNYIIARSSDGYLYIKTFTNGIYGADWTRINQATDCKDGSPIEFGWCSEIKKYKLVYITGRGYLRVLFCDDAGLQSGTMGLEYETGWDNRYTPDYFKCDFQSNGDVLILHTLHNPYGDNLFCALRCPRAGQSGGSTGYTVLTGVKGKFGYLPGGWVVISKVSGGLVCAKFLHYRDYSRYNDGTLYKSDIPKSTSTDGEIALGRNADGRLQFFCTNPNDPGVIYTAYQMGSSPWSAEQPLLSGTPTAFRIAPNSAITAAYNSSTGRMEIFYKTNSQYGRLAHSWQSGPNSGWNYSDSQEWTATSATPANGNIAVSTFGPNNYLLWATYDSMKINHLDTMYQDPSSASYWVGTSFQ